MFIVTGKDGKEYGPTTADEVRSWIKQGRLTADSKARLEGTTEWKALKEFAEFGDLAVPPVSAPPPLVTSALAGPSKLSGLAIASLVCGVLGFVTFGLTGLVGVVLGVIALVRISKSQGRLSGTGLAIAGTCISGVLLVLLPLMAAMLLPALMKAKGRAQDILCMNNVKQLNLALILYANDHGNQLPPESNWCDLIKPYTGGSGAVFHCQTQPAGRCSYAYNAGIANQKLTDLTNPAQTVLIFSSEEGWNRAGGLNAAIPHKHGGSRVNIGFLDGHAETVTADRLKALEWER